MACLRLSLSAAATAVCSALMRAASSGREFDSVRGASMLRLSLPALASHVAAGNVGATPARGHYRTSTAARLMKPYPRNGGRASVSASTSLLTQVVAFLTR